MDNKLSERSKPAAHVSDESFSSRYQRHNNKKLPIGTALFTAPPAEPNEPVEKPGTWKTPDVVFGWNECRTAMLAEAEQQNIEVDDSQTVNYRNKSLTTCSAKVFSKSLMRLDEAYVTTVDGGPINLVYSEQPFLWQRIISLTMG